MIDRTPKSRAEAGADAGLREDGRDGQDPDVHPEERDDEVAAPVAREVEGEREDGDGDGVDRVEQVGRHGCVSGCRRAAAAATAGRGLMNTE